jgi:hypothetical protein
MGFNGCWVAVKGRSFDDVAREIGLLRADSKAEPLAEVVTRAGTLKNGWTVFYGGRWDDQIVKPDILANLSRDAQLVACQAYEMTMFSETQLWVNGAMIWIISHDSETGDINNLKIEGNDFPKNLGNLRQLAIKRQQEKDKVDFMFDVPVVIAEEISGFNHNKEGAGEIEGSEFFPMTSKNKTRQPSIKQEYKPWWKFWR